MSEIFDKIAVSIPAETQIFVEKSMSIVLTIREILLKKGITQKEFAKRLGKSESEISKWLSPSYNLTLRSIAKIEAVLGEPILVSAKFLDEYKGSFEPETTPNKVSPILKNYQISIIPIFSNYNKKWTPYKRQ